MSFFCVNHLSAGYGRQTIIDDISMKIESGQLVGILGANGSGKTTLLKAFCGIISHSGQCYLEDVILEDLSPRRIAKLVSYIPQRSGISIDISALDVVLMGFNPSLGLFDTPDDTMKEQALCALTAVGLKDSVQTNYLHLSEGQKQLCILARTLVSDTKLLLLDEPESSLDFPFRYQMLQLIKEYISLKKRSAVVTLHDPALALNHCDVLVLLDGGKMIATANPALEPIDKLEQKLKMIYGNISLHRITNRSGQPCLVMLKEE